MAPWLDPNGLDGDFLKFELNPNLTQIIEDIDVFYSTDDDVAGVAETVEILKKVYPDIDYHEFNDHGHFCLGDMGTEAFPELLEVVK